MTKQELTQHVNWNGYDLIPLAAIINAVHGGAIIMVHIEPDGPDKEVSSENDCRYLIDVAAARWRKEAHRK